MNGCDKILTSADIKLITYCERFLIVSIDKKVLNDLHKSSFLLKILMICF